MPPFGAAGGVDRDNPRTIWRAAEEAAEAPTMAVFSGNKGDNGDGETAVFSPAGAATATLPLADMPPRPPAGAEQATQLLPDAAADFTDDAGTQVLTGATTPMPDQTTPLAERTAVLPTPQPVPQPIPPLAPQPVPFGQNGWNPAGVNQPTAVDPAIRPAIAARHRPSRPSRAPTEATGPGPARAQSRGRDAAGMYLQHGALPLFLLAAPLAALAANAPLVALIAADMRCLWLLLTLALQHRAPAWSARAGAAASAKTPIRWIRVATLPWHLVKALLLAMPRILYCWLIVYLAGTAVRHRGSWHLPVRDHLLVFHRGSEHSGAAAR